MVSTTVLFLLLFAELKLAASLDCTTYGRNCYPLSKTHGLLTFEEAHGICTDNGYDGLVTIPWATVDKPSLTAYYQIVTAESPGAKVWLSHTLKNDSTSGGSRAFESDFDCTTTASDLFLDGQPDGKPFQDTCLLFTAAGLDDVHCLTEAYAICERIIDDGVYSAAEAAKCEQACQLAEFSDLPAKDIPLNRCPRQECHPYVDGGDSRGKQYTLVSYGTNAERGPICDAFGRKKANDVHNIACGLYGAGQHFRNMVATAGITDIPTATLWSSYEYNYTTGIWGSPLFKLDCAPTYNFTYTIPPGDPSNPNKGLVYNTLKDKFELKERSEIGLITCADGLTGLNTAAGTQAPSTCPVPPRPPNITTPLVDMAPPPTYPSTSDCDGKCIAVRVIQDIGCLYLIGLMAFTIAVFIIVKERHIERYLHLCQELTLMCGHIVIIMLRDKFYIKSLCLTSSIVVHYMLSSCTWFLGIEAWHNMTILMNVLSTGAWPGAGWLIPLGFLGPLLFVGALAAGWHGEHAGANTCWINFDSEAVPIGMLVPSSLLIGLAFVFWEASDTNFRLPCAPKLKYYVAFSNRVHWPFVAALALAAWILGAAAVYGYAIVTYVFVTGLNIALGTMMAYTHIIGSRPAVNLVMKLWKKLTRSCRGNEATNAYLGDGNKRKKEDQRDTLIQHRVLG